MNFKIQDVQGKYLNVIIKEGDTQIDMGTLVTAEAADLMEILRDAACDIEDWVADQP